MRSAAATAMVVVTHMPLWMCIDFWQERLDCLLVEKGVMGIMVYVRIHSLRRITKLAVMITSILVFMRRT
jgi:hypothetical protein